MALTFILIKSSAHKEQIVSGNEKIKSFEPKLGKNYIMLHIMLQKKVIIVLLISGF
jgi:hypothetical protein